MLEDTVHCNDRFITNYGAWNPNGGNTTSNSALAFKNSNNTVDLTCSNEKDQFAVGNNKARLIYPVGLISGEEWYNILTNSLRRTGSTFWTISPNSYNYLPLFSTARYIDTDGSLYTADISEAYGVRPAITLSSGAIITSGDGSEANPWVIE